MINFIRPFAGYIMLIALLGICCVYIKYLRNKNETCNFEMSRAATTLELQNSAIKSLHEEEKKTQDKYIKAEKEANKERIKARKEAQELARIKVPEKCEDAIKWAVDVSSDM